MSQMAPAATVSLKDAIEEDQPDCHWVRVEAKECTCA
jgi:hypothetical protein